MSMIFLKEDKNLQAVPVAKAKREEASQSHVLVSRTACAATCMAYLRTSADRHAATSSVISKRSSTVSTSLLFGSLSEVCFRADAPWAPFRRLGEWMAPPGQEG